MNLEWELGFKLEDQNSWKVVRFCSDGILMNEGRSSTKRSSGETLAIVCKVSENMSWKFCPALIFIPLSIMHCLLDYIFYPVLLHSD